MKNYFGIFIIVTISLLAFLAPLLFPYDFQAFHLSESLKGPTLNHLFGLDEFGQDVFIKIIYGARLSLFVTFCVVGVSFLIGLIFGTLAGFFGSYIELAIMAVADMVLAFPKFLLALALLAMTGSSVFHLIFALSFSTWAGFARLVRAEVKHLKEKEFVLNAESYGASSFLQWKNHIFPNLIGLLAIHGMFQAVAVLIAESGLNFLGLGGSLEVPSWGGLLSAGRSYIFEAPHLCFFPGLFLFLFLLSLNFLGTSLRDHFDPQS